MEQILLKDETQIVWYNILHINTNPIPLFLWSRSLEGAVDSNGHTPIRSIGVQYTSPHMYPLLTSPQHRRSFALGD